MHSEENRVKSIQKLLGKVRSKALEVLRYKAEHDWNLEKIKQGKGEIILARRETEKFRLKQYSPCPLCFGWMKTTALVQHQPKCSARHQGTPLKTIGVLKVQAAVLAGRMKNNPSEAMMKEVFTIMREDDVGILAREDALIISVGNMWLLRCGANKIMRAYYTSSIMRLLGRLKKHLMVIKPIPQPSLWNYMKPEHYEVIAKATLLCCRLDEEEPDMLEAPSNTIKLGFDLKRLMGIKEAESIILKDKQSKEDAQELAAIMKTTWSYKVTKLARTVLDERLFNKKVILPEPDDIVKLATYLSDELSGFDFETVVCYDDWAKLAKLLEARTILYNRRRPGEVQGIRLSQYRNRTTGVAGIEQELLNEMSPLEQELVMAREAVNIRGKRGRCVPLIIPPGAVKGMEFLGDEMQRNKVGIPAKSPYLFANKTCGVFRGYYAVSTACGKAGLKAAGALCATSMRKYMATISQMLVVDGSDMRNLLTHMGHNWDVHRHHYRQVSSVIERCDIAKLLLIQDKGLVAENRRKELSQIHISEVTFREILQNAQPQEQQQNDADVDMPVEDLVPLDMPEEAFVPLEEGGEDEEIEWNLPETQNKKKTPRKRVSAVKAKRHKWTRKEEEELKKLFPVHFRDGTCPRTADCEKARLKSVKNHGTVHLQRNDNIKKKVNNMIWKEKNEIE